MMQFVKDHPYFLRKAFEVAETASGIRGRFRTGAIIAVGNHIISEGRNTLKSHPFAKAFSKNSEAIYLHAEHEAILKASRKLGKRDWHKARLYVARTTKSNQFGLAKPCNGCACAIDHFKIGLVVYSLDAGEHLNYVSYSTKSQDLFVHSEIK
jgi:tRNA(Arg) A34 adenosine deaminase TadA